ncbi:MAG TPA: porin [Acidobacteriaceae bacterium]|nr:porin [Acidobacteriaceae bacterium]
MKLRMFFGLSFAIFGGALAAAAQTQSAPEPTAAPASTAPAPAPAAATPPVWSVGSLDFSGYLDGYYSYNANRPSNAANGQVNDLYNFNDKTDQFNLSAAKLTINHDPDPIGVHVDLLFGRTNVLMHSSSDQSTDDYIEQAYISAKPNKTHGAEFDFGQFVTSAGAEVIEAKDDWNYSRSLLFAWAIPYYHFGLRTSVPVTKSWTAGVQVVNGWNNVVDNNGGVTIGLTSALTKPKYAWALNYYTGPENTDTQKGYRNLIDTTLTLTPTSKLSAYINYDYGQNRTPNLDDEYSASSLHWQGVAFAVRGQVTGKSALAARYEYYDDQGFQTGTAQDIQEFTATYEYKWLAGLLMRAEFRRDWSDQPFFHKDNYEFVDAQTTATVGFIAFFGPKR